MPTDGSMLRPDCLGALNIDALAATTVSAGRRKKALGDLFDIEGQAGSRLTIRAAPPWHRVGAAIASGQLIIDGDVGDLLGASMTGGQIHVRGSAGGCAGGPDRGATRGMTGGEILVEGDAGDYVGLKMQRGLIAVNGSTGKSPGYRMLAGTIALGGAQEECPFDHPGLEMKRGTILIMDPQARLLLGEGFTESGQVAASALPAIGMLRRRLARLGYAGKPELHGGCYRLYHGDRFELNKGEILQWVC